MSVYFNLNWILLCSIGFCCVCCFAVFSIQQMLFLNCKSTFIFMKLDNKYAVVKTRCVWSDAWKDLKPWLSHFSAKIVQSAISKNLISCHKSLRTTTIYISSHIWWCFLGRLFSGFKDDLLLRLPFYHISNRGSITTWGANESSQGQRRVGCTLSFTKGKKVVRPIKMFTSCKF